MVRHFRPTALRKTTGTVPRRSYRDSDDEAEAAARSGGRREAHGFWERIQRFTDPGSRPAYETLNIRVSQLFIWQLATFFVLLITILIAGSQFGNSTMWVVPRLGAKLLSISWVVIAFSLSCAVFGGFIWWRRLVFRRLLLFLDFAGGMGLFIMLVWTTAVCASAMGDVFTADSNYAEQKGLFMWYIVLLVVDDIIHLGILFSFVRFWREMVSESAPPPRRPTFELPLPPDVIAAHAAATAGVSPAGKGGKDPGRKKKKKKGKGRGKGESPQGPSFDDMEEGRAGVVTPPVGGSGAAYSIRGPGDARGFTPGVDEGRSESDEEGHHKARPRPGGGLRNDGSVDIDIDRGESPDVHTPLTSPAKPARPETSTPSRMGATAPEAAPGGVVAPTASGAPAPAAGDSWSMPSIVVPVSVPVAAPTTIHTMSPDRFEEYWAHMADSGSFDCRVSEIPERYTLIGHLSSRGFETVASGLVDGVLKVYFYATGSTLAAVGFGSQSVAPTTAFLAEFRFVTSELKLYAKFKCSDEAATATFVRRFRLQSLFKVMDSGAEATV